MKCAFRGQAALLSGIPVSVLPLLPVVVAEEAELPLLAVDVPSTGQLDSASCCAD